MTVTPDDILTFWFEDDPVPRREKWFEKNANFDTACARFTVAVRAARAGAHDAWAETPKGALALIILMDQFSRNIFRGSGESFAADPHALKIARAAIARGFDVDLTPCEKMFMYLPFEHAETMADQDESVRLFDPIRVAIGYANADYARRHRDVIARFGRFPHRNILLGRVNTRDEEDYLGLPGAGF